MPRKIRELEAELLQHGFQRREGKGSHRMWVHPSGVRVNMSGKSGEDCQFYQEKNLKLALYEIKKRSS